MRVKIVRTGETLWVWGKPPTDAGDRFLAAAQQPPRQVTSLFDDVTAFICGRRKPAMRKFVYDPALHELFAQAELFG